MSSLKINNIFIPDSKIVREATELVKSTENDLLFNHSCRVYYWGALTGEQRKLKYDPELLYLAAIFHDMGLTHQHKSSDKRFEVDSANIARDFMKGHGISEQDMDLVWTAIALHTTPGIPEFMHPVIALMMAGVTMDILGIDYSKYDNEIRERVVKEYPRSTHFKEDIIQALFDGIKHKPSVVFGSVNADLFEDKDPSFKRANFCNFIRDSQWKE